MEGNDMITNLYRLPKLEDRKDTIQIKRAFVGDKGAILNFIKSNFSDSWVYEAEHAIMQEMPKCFIAVENKKVIGFACYDSSAKGFFGPIGVHPDYRGKCWSVSSIKNALCYEGIWIWLCSYWLGW